MHTHTYTHIHAHIMTYLYFVWLLLKKLNKGCKGATKSLQVNNGAAFSRCTHFMNGATFTRL